MIAGLAACTPSTSPDRPSGTALATASTSTELAPTPTATSAAPSFEATPVPDDWQQFGTSVQGRPIRALTLGHGPRRVLFVGGIHGDETEGAYATSQLPAAFEAAGLADAVTLVIVEDVNPDGRAAGTRENANGVDVNRNFPATNFDPSNGGEPLSQPESRALKEIFERTDPALVLVMHSWNGRQFVNFDGPARELAERFAAAIGVPVEASNSFAPTPGSLGSYVGRDQGTPILTIELLKGSDGQANWERIREPLLQAIAG